MSADLQTLCAIVAVVFVVGSLLAWVIERLQ
jgi:uncharacterized membrane protein YciS (DUF1049 family)